MNSIVVALHVIVSIFIVAAVLLQPASKSSGFGSSFSGSCTTDSAFGARGPIPFLVKLTYWLAAAIMLTSLILEVNIIKKSKSILDSNLTPSVALVVDEPDGSSCSNHNGLSSDSSVVGNSKENR